MAVENEINKLIQQNNLHDLYILARYYYRIGEPMLNDGLYDQLERTLKAQESEDSDLQAFFARTYDDDPVPVDLLAQIGEEPAAFISIENKSELFDSLNEDKSYSIRSVTSYDEAWDFFNSLKENKLDFMTSLKMDGDNTKMLYVDGEFALSMSRGRKGTSFDFTKSSALVVPKHINTTQHEMKVTGESYVEESALEYLRKKYNPSQYKTSKSAAISMLRVLHDVSDYKYLKTRVFSAEGLANTLSDMFASLEAQGFDTPPHKLFKWAGIPDRDNFDAWLKTEVFDWFAEQGKGMPSDGVVVEVNDLLWTGVATNQYTTRQLALKFEQWGFKYTKGIITDIMVEQQRVFASIRVRIEPVVQYDGCVATVINAFDLDILQSNDLKVGSEVYFEKNSGAVNILIHGNKLISLKEGEKDASV